MGWSWWRWWTAPRGRACQDAIEFGAMEAAIDQWRESGATWDRGKITLFVNALLTDRARLTAGRL